jgi:hypothetical protein
LSKLAVSPWARPAIIDSAEVEGLERREGSSVASSDAQSDQWREEKMALQVHGGGDLGKTVLWIVAIVAFVAIALTKVPELISPNSANVTGGTGATSRMIN